MWTLAASAIVLVAVIAGVAFLIRRSKNRKRVSIIVAIALAWVLGVGFALVQLLPGLAQRLPTPFGLEGQRDVREVSLDEAKRLAAFPIFAPTRLPGRAVLESVRVQRAGRASDVVVVLTYYDSRSNSQVRVWESVASGPAISPGQANLKIMGQNARVTPTDDGTEVEWSVGLTRIEIAGELDRRALVEMAGSMR